MGSTRSRSNPFDHFIGTPPRRREIAPRASVRIILGVQTPRLYCEGLRVGRNLLSEEESHHATRVLRLAENDSVVLFNGAGGEAQGRIAGKERSSICVDVPVVSTRAFESRHRLTLAVAMTKAHRQSYLIEKCTELGAAAFWPILTERSVTRPAEAAVEKWTRRAIEAAKQSRRAWVPIVAASQSLAGALAKRAGHDLAVVAEPGSREPFGIVLQELVPESSVLIFIGPEGGWSPQELENFMGAGVRAVALAPTTLRTETAAVAASAAVALLSAAQS